MLICFIKADYTECFSNISLKTQLFQSQPIFANWLLSSLEAELASELLCVSSYYLRLARRVSLIEANQRASRGRDRFFGTAKQDTAPSIERNYRTIRKAVKLGVRCALAAPRIIASLIQSSENVTWLCANILRISLINRR